MYHYCTMRSAVWVKESDKLSSSRSASAMRRGKHWHRGAVQFSFYGKEKFTVITPGQKEQLEPGQSIGIWENSIIIMITRARRAAVVTPQ